VLSTVEDSNKGARLRRPQDCKAEAVLPKEIVRALCANRINNDAVDRNINDGAEGLARSWCLGTGLGCFGASEAEILLCPLLELIKSILRSWYDL